jgi:hypothetical protein
MAEIYTCFEFLVENTPTWIRDVEELERRIEERQVEIEKIPASVSRNNKRTPSNESLRENGRPISGPNCYATASPEAALSSNGYVDGYSHGATYSPSSQRKRKTSSILSNNTAPVKSRSRSMVIVYYDSRVQATFEQLVRNIGAGRNHIRKARMAARIEALVGSENTDDEIPAFRSTRHFGLSSTHITNARNTSSADDNRMATDSALNEVDAALEQAQGFCEKGAHQFLRDGDCGEETANTKNSFRTLLEVAERELARQNLQLQERREEDRRLADATLAATAAVTQAEMVIPTTGALVGGPIEADDDDNDDTYDTLNVRLPSFRATARV